MRQTFNAELTSEPKQIAVPLLADGLNPVHHSHCIHIGRKLAKHPMSTRRLEQVLFCVDADLIAFGNRSVTNLGSLDYDMEEVLEEARLRKW